MDARIINTNRRIQDAFIKLRQTKKTEKITIRELSATADINKATFYLHYHDIYDLEYKLEEELIKNIVNDFKSLDITHESLEELFKKTLKILERYDKELKILSTSSHYTEFVDRLVNAYKAYIKESDESLLEDEYLMIGVSFLIRGAYLTFFHYDNKRLNDIIDFKIPFEFKKR